ncbi:NAD(P)-binding domain-containing protein [Nocardioides sp. NPDC127514]|uniref:NADPH-dependent F420 reductase n=1 Tax=Nocardioides sp. NPDC127514 TaxID=3154243 RepID=UPI00331ACD21
MNTTHPSAQNPTHHQEINMTGIGIIGAGGIGSAIARRLATTGSEVLLANSRGAHTVRVPDDRVTAVDATEAAKADIVVLAVPWNRLEAAVANSGIDDWSDKIVIDPTNPLSAPDFRPADLGGAVSSTQLVERLVPGARVVKALGTLTPADLAADPTTAGRRVVFVSGDDDIANRTVAALAAKAGWAPINLGPLAIGGPLLHFPGGPLPTLRLRLER